MTPREFQAIKEKIETAKEKKARAEGAKAKIEEQWKRDYGINSIEEASEKVTELESGIEEDKKKLEKLYNTLEKITDWDDVE